MAGFPPAMMAYNIISRVIRFFKGGSAICPKNFRSSTFSLDVIK